MLPVKPIKGFGHSRSTLMCSGGEGKENLPQASTARELDKLSSASETFQPHCPRYGQIQSVQVFFCTQPSKPVRLTRERDPGRKVVGSRW